MKRKAAKSSFGGYNNQQEQKREKKEIEPETKPRSCFRIAI